MRKDENLAIIEEINEELKHDQMMAFMKKYSNAIIGFLVAVVLGILIYSAWNERHKHKMEDITNALLTVVQNPAQKNILLLDKLLEDAPAELRPMLMIMKSGKQLSMGEDVEKNLQPLLDLSTRTGVDIVWKDLATLIYVSYSTKNSDELIEMLIPLTQEKRPFRFSALETIGMIYFNNGKLQESLTYLEKIANDKEAPTTLKERINIAIQYIKHEVPATETTSVADNNNNSSNSNNSVNSSEVNKGETENEAH